MTAIFKKSAVLLLIGMTLPSFAWAKVTPIEDYQEALKSSEDDLTGQPDSLACVDYGLLSTAPPEYKYACNSGVHVGVDGCTDDTSTRYKSCECAKGYVAGSSFTKNTALVNYPQASVSDGGGVVCYEKSKFSCRDPYNASTKEEKAKMVTYKTKKPHDWLPTDCVTGYDLSPLCQESIGAASTNNCIKITDDYQVTLKGYKQIYCATGCSSDDTCAESTKTCIDMTKQKHGSKTCYKINGCATNCLEKAPDKPPFTSVPHTSKETTCYEVTGCDTANKYTSAQPSTTYFTSETKTAGGKTCYKVTGCATGYTEASKPSEDIFSDVKGSKDETTSTSCYKVGGCKEPYTAQKEPNATYFVSDGAAFGNTSCYNVTKCATGYGDVNATIFTRDGATNGNFKCYKATGCATGYDKVEEMPSTDYFAVSGGESGGFKCYKVTACAKDYSDVSATIFTREGATYGSFKCYKATGCATGYDEVDEKPSTSYFKVSGDESGGFKCFKVSGCADGYGEVNGSIFERKGATYGSFACYKATGCTGDYSTEKPGAAYTYDEEKDEASGITCYKKNGCATGYHDVNTCWSGCYGWWFK